MTTESLPNPANTSGSTTPLPPVNPLEITPLEIEQASFSDIANAVYDQMDRMQAALRLKTNPTEQAAIRKNVIAANNTERALGYWDQSNNQRSSNDQPTETFSAFLDRTAFEADASPDLAVASDWVLDHEDLIKDVIITRKQEQAAAEALPMPVQPERLQADPAAEARQQAERQRDVDQARDSVERARGAEIFDDVVRIGKNKTQLYSNLRGGYQQLGDGDRNKQNTVWIDHESVIKVAERKPDWRQHLNEAVMFSEVVEPETRTVTRKIPVVKTGRFGRTHTIMEDDITEEPIPGSEHPVLVRNEQTGQDEPMVRFRYRFAYSLPTMRSGEVPEYKEFHGTRSGQQVHVALDLPKSIADTLQSQIQEDPASVRTLAERLFLENNNGAMTKQDWHEGSDSSSKDPVRPPYEDLPADWTVAMVTGRESNRYGRQDILDHTVQRLPIKIK